MAAHEKVVTSQSKGFLAKEQRLKDRESKEALRKGGGPELKEAIQRTKVAEQAEVASYKLNKRSKF